MLLSASPRLGNNDRTSCATRPGALVPDYFTLRLKDSASPHSTLSVWGHYLVRGNVLPELTQCQERTGPGVCSRPAPRACRSPHRRLLPEKHVCWASQQPGKALRSGFLFHRGAQPGPEPQPFPRLLLAFPHSGPATGSALQTAPVPLRFPPSGLSKAGNETLPRLTCDHLG